MATREQLRRLQTAQPIRPFLVKLADGRQVEGRHPELAESVLLLDAQTRYFVQCGDTTGDIMTQMTA